MSDAYQTVRIADLVIDLELQPRIRLDIAVVRTYMTALEEGANFPPITVFDVDGSLVLSDGWHRVEAHKQIGKDAVEAEIREGDRRDAIWHGIAHNSRHGLRFSTKDKQRALERLLTDEDWSCNSDNALAQVVGVDHKTVAAARNRLAGAVGTKGNSQRKGKELGNSQPDRVPIERQQHTRSREVITAYGKALDALTEAEGTDRVQTEIGKWWAQVSGGGLVKFLPPKGRR